MGLSGPLPPNLTRKMNAADRKALGQVAKTPEECDEEASLKLERKEQSLFAGLLRQRMERGQLIYDWSATHKANTGMVGRADFWIAANNRILQLEFKAPTGKLSPEQKKMREYSEAAGVDYHVVFSATEAHELLMEWLMNST